jgi:hypothetical protein
MRLSDIKDTNRMKSSYRNADHHCLNNTRTNAAIPKIAISHASIEASDLGPGP